MSSPDESGYGSPTVPPGAVFVTCDDPIRVFPSAAAAARHLETIDTEDEPCPVAYGPQGEIYGVRYEGTRVHIELADEPSRPDELKDCLLHYLDCCEDPGDATDTLDRLVNDAWRIERDYWQRMQPDGGGAGTRISGWTWIGSALVLAVILYLLFRTLR
jgi:hypothetical protein